MTLKLADQDTIELPDWIGGTSLTLEEIGVIAVLACVQNGSAVPEVTARLGTLETAKCLQSLQHKKVMVGHVVGDRVKIEIDLLAVLPSSLAQSGERNETPIQ